MEKAEAGSALTEHRPLLGPSVFPTSSVFCGSSHCSSALAEGVSLMGTSHGRAAPFFWRRYLRLLQFHVLVRLRLHPRCAHRVFLSRRRLRRAMLKSLRC